MPVQQRGNDGAGLWLNVSSSFPFVGERVWAPCHCETLKTAVGSWGGTERQEEEIFGCNLVLIVSAVSGPRARLSDLGHLLIIPMK